MFGGGPGGGAGQAASANSQAATTIYGRDSNASSLPEWVQWAALGLGALLAFVVILKALKE